MRNDARPIGEAVRQEHSSDEHEPQNRDRQQPPPQPRTDRKGFIKDRDPGDEEVLPTGDATLRTEI